MNYDPNKDDLSYILCAQPTCPCCKQVNAVDASSEKFDNAANEADVTCKSCKTAFRVRRTITYSTLPNYRGPIVSSL